MTLTFTDKRIVATISLGARTTQQIYEETGIQPAAINVSLDAMQASANRIAAKKRNRPPTCIVHRGVDSNDIRDQLLYPEPPLTIIGVPT